MYSNIPPLYMRGVLVRNEQAGSYAVIFESFCAPKIIDAKGRGIFHR